MFNKTSGKVASTSARLDGKHRLIFSPEKKAVNPVLRMLHKGNVPEILIILSE